MSNAKHATTESGRKSHAEAAHNRARKIQESLPSQQVDFAQSETPFVVTDEDLMGEDISSVFGEAGLSSSSFDEPSPIEEPKATFSDEGQLDGLDDVSSLFDDVIPFNETMSWQPEPAFDDAVEDASDLLEFEEELEHAVSIEAIDDVEPSQDDHPSDDVVVDNSPNHVSPNAVQDESPDSPQEHACFGKHAARDERSDSEKEDDSSDEAYAAYQAKERRKSLPIIIGVVIAVVVVAAAVIFVLGSRGVFGGGSNESTNSTVNVAVNENTNNVAATENASTSNATNVNANVNANAAAQTTYEYTKNIPEVAQYPTFYGGCEVVALEMFLRAFGYDVTATTLADRYLEYGSSYVTTYSGDPYVSGAGYPPVMVKCAMSYLASVGSNAEVIGFKGEPFDKVVSYVKRGVPVVVWTTISCADPQLTGITVDGYEWYENEHNVVVYGVDNDYVYVVDPVDGYTRRDRAKFESVYAACGAMGYTMNL